MDGAVPIVGAVVNRKVEGALAVSTMIDDESVPAFQCRAVVCGGIGGDADWNDGTLANEDRVAGETVGLRD